MPTLLRALAAGLTASAFVVACGGGGGGGSSTTPAVVPTTGSGAPGVTSTASPATSPTAGQQAAAVSVVDYFTAQTIGSASVTVDGAPLTHALSTGLHTLVVTAPGYATFNGAIQVPGGAANRTVKLFPVSPSMTAWLAQIDADRAANGAGAVQLDDMLSIAAYDHAGRSSDSGLLRALRPAGVQPEHALAAAGLDDARSGRHRRGLRRLGRRGKRDDGGAYRAAAPGRRRLPNEPESLAGHYCNIVWPLHNWVGLALLSAPGGATQYGTYYDQEFGELYGVYDTTVPPAAASAGSLSFAGANGSTLGTGYVATLATPAPIAIATLNADPRCASSCPAADQWYPSAGNTFFSAGTWTFTTALSSSQLTFPELSSNVAGLFDGAAIDADAWPGATVTPATYTGSTWNVTTSVARYPASVESGRLVPNGPEILPR